MCSTRGEVTLPLTSQGIVQHWAIPDSNPRLFGRKFSSHRPSRGVYLCHEGNKPRICRFLSQLLFYPPVLRWQDTDDDGVADDENGPAKLKEENDDENLWNM